MKKRKKGGDEMTTLSLTDLESSVRANNRANKAVIDSFTNDVRRNKSTERVRPKAETESRILSRFTKK